MNRPVESDYTSMTAYTRALEAYCDFLQPEREPVAWLEPEWGQEICPEVGYAITMTEDHPRDLCWIPLYAHPPQRTWVGLTDDEVAQAMYRADAIFTGPMQFKFAKEIEAKLKEKNERTI